MSGAGVARGHLVARFSLTSPHLFSIYPCIQILEQFGEWEETQVTEEATV